MKILKHLLTGKLLNKVDFILLLIVIAFLVKDFEQYAFLSFFIVYIIAVIVRLASAMDRLNEYVTDRTYRERLNLYPIPGEYPRRRKTIFQITVKFIFWLTLASILIYWAIT